MPRQFSPSDRETVVDMTTAYNFVHEAGCCGPGVFVICEAGDNTVRHFTGLVENHGWYVDKYQPDEAGETIVLMPITEVPE